MILRKQASMLRNGANNILLWKRKFKHNFPPIQSLGVGCFGYLHSWSHNLRCSASFLTSTDRKEQGQTENLEMGKVLKNDVGKQKQTIDNDESGLNPRELVSKLDNFIVGQTQAKRAVAIALRNRWRRQHLPESLRLEVIPKNILMIGPTGCGKTEIARRISKLCQAPFIKVEATKFTEVGFHGRDVDQIIKDLADAALNMIKAKKRNENREKATKKAEERALELLTAGNPESEIFTIEESRDCTIEVPVNDKFPIIDMYPISDKFPVELGPLFQKMSKMNVFNTVRKTTRKMKVSEAVLYLTETELESMIDDDEIKRLALQAVQENGIVFIDEIDKVCTTQGYQGADASAEGVQRDLLPLIEGCAISTRLGTVNTDYILFIASGAFHSCKPSDLLAELQGRLPIRVELSLLSEADLYRILTEPEPNLIRQSVEMMKVENIELQFEDEAIRAIAHVAAEVNRTVENIGARRLQTIVEKVMEEISFGAPDMEKGTKITITASTVKERVTDLMIKSDVSKYIL